MVWQDDNSVSFLLDHKIYLVPYVPSSSSAKLTYQDTQKAIDSKSLGDIEKDINILHGLASKLRARRFQDGTLGLEVLSLAFKLDESGLPIDCGQYKPTEANYLIEEVGCNQSYLHVLIHNLSLVYVTEQYLNCPTHSCASS